MSPSVELHESSGSANQKLHTKQHDAHRGRRPFEALVSGTKSMSSSYEASIKSFHLSGPREQSLEWKD